MAAVTLSEYLGSYAQLKFPLPQSTFTYHAQPQHGGGNALSIQIEKRQHETTAESLRVHLHEFIFTSARKMRHRVEMEQRLAFIIQVQ